MSGLPIAVSDDWLYFISAEPVASLPSAHSLEVSSQWLGAKDPEGKVRQLQILVLRADLQNLRDYLDAYLRFLP